MTAPTGTARTPAQQAAQFEPRLAAFITHAERRSPGFRRRLVDAGLAGGDVRTVADLDRLPVLTKDRLLEEQRADAPFGGYLADDAKPARVFQSPGPLYEPQFDDDDPWRWAPALAAAGFSAEDVVLNAFGYHLSPAGMMFDAACRTLGATVLPAGIGTKDLQVTAAADLGVTAYIGPPSYLKALFEAAEVGGLPLALSRAFVTAEPLPPSLRASLSQRVAVVRQGYGTAETGLLGFECNETAGLHVPDDALVQICHLDTSQARHDAGEGQVVVTLFDASYPIVRFGTGDLSAWFLEPCPCGFATPRIRGWLGRVGDAVKVKGMFLHPAQVAAVLGRLRDVAAYRVVIDRMNHRDVLRCEVVPGDDAGPSLPDEVARVMRDGLRFQVEVEVVDAIPEDRPAIDDIRTWD